MTERRPVGSLEAEVLATLWQRGEPMTPAQTLEALGGDLAYTTVLTILSRLWQKGLVRRERVGRAYAYEPVLTEPDRAAEHMRQALDRSRDQAAVLHRFVDALSPDEATLLRDLVQEREPE